MNIRIYEDNEFTCIINERLLDSVRKLKEKEYVYIIGCGVCYGGLLTVIVNEIYKL